MWSRMTVSSSPESLLEMPNLNPPPPRPAPHTHTLNQDLHLNENCRKFGSMVKFNSAEQGESDHLGYLG